MKQILRNLGNVETMLAEVPCPGVHGPSFLVHDNATDWTGS
jgi:hypothetical protein